MFKLLDNYTLQARVAPVLVVMLPGLLWFVGLFPPDTATLGLFTSIFATGGLGILLGQLGRDRGKAKEKKLFKKWGETPTTKFFRHHDDRFNPKTTAAMHANMRRLIPDSPEIRPEDEEKDPVTADQVYSRWTSYLRENTRDPAVFPIIHAENINYGFRRNLYGLRVYAIAIALWPLFIKVLSYIGKNPIATPVDWITLASSTLLLAFYLIVANSKWVQVAAEAYADRLIRASDKLVADQEASRTP